MEVYPPNSPGIYRYRKMVAMETVYVLILPVGVTLNFKHLEKYVINMFYFPERFEKSVLFHMLLLLI